MNIIVFAPVRLFGDGLGACIATRAGITVEAVVSDLGALRGSAEVAVDGASVSRLFAGPWRVDITDAVADGRTHLLRVTVRGTLAPYLEAASPTAAVMAGQTVHGLFGPVRIEVRNGMIMGGTVVPEEGAR